MKVRGRLPIKPEKIQRILIRATNWVGDAVMCLPAIEAIRHNFPLAKISILAKPWVRDLYDFCPAIDRIITLDQKTGFFRSRYQVIKELRKEDFDLAILFQNAFDAAMISFLAAIPYRIGYNTDGRSWLLTHRVIRSAEILHVHQVYYYLGLLKAMGWESESQVPHLVIPAESRKEAITYLRTRGVKEGDLLLGFNPGAYFGSAKRWFPERFASVADKAVEELSARIIIFGSQRDVPTVREMAGLMKHPVIIAAGETGLKELTALIAECSLFITNDSGSMHISAAVNTPTIAIFGSTDPTTTSPFGEEHTIVRHPVPCSPCLRRECPTDHQCMKLVTVKEVWQIIEEKIQKL